MKMKNLRLFVTIMVVFFLTIIGGNCIAFARNYDKIVIAQVKGPTTMDITDQTFQQTQNVLKNIVEPLLEETGESGGEFTPCLATSWEYISDKEIKFHLRRGVVFHNGDPFTAKDVKFSFDFMQNPSNRSPLAGKLTVAFEGIEIIDDYTVVFKTNEIYAPALSALAHYFCIIPKKFIEAKGREEYAKYSIGTGPYELDKWVRGEYVKLKAFDKYWGKKPEVKEIIFRVIPEATSRVSALELGEVDIITEVPFEKRAEVEKSKTTKLVNYYWCQHYIGLNTFEKPFDSVKVRHALNYAIDRQAIIDSILNKDGKLQSGPICPRTFGYDPDLKPYEYNPNKAKKLLAEAGYSNGFETELSIENDLLNIQQIAEAIQSYLNKVGVRVNIQPYDPSVMWEKYRNKKLHMYIYPWDDPPEPNTYIYPLLNSQARGYYYKNLLVDALIEKGYSTVNREERKEVYHSLCQIVHNDAPWVFLWVYPEKFGMAEDIDWQPNRYGYTIMKNLKFIK